MEDIDAYLEKELRRLDFATADGTDKFQVVQQQYEYSQLLMAVGRQKEAVNFLQQSFEELDKVKREYKWRFLYCSVGRALACALDYLNDLKNAEVAFRAIMEVDPVGIHIGDFALFLHRRKRDFDKAEQFYKKTLELYPDHSSIHLKYAGLLRHVRRNLAAAEEHYIKSVEANPLNSDAIGSYASFLHGVHGNIDAAEKYYIQSIEADSCHTNNLCNYGLFLSEEKADYEAAERMYIKSLEVNPKHANTLYNYAVMLDTHVKDRKDEAEQFYRRALNVEPRHAYALYNLAVLLEERYSTKIRNLTNTELLDLQDGGSAHEEDLKLRTEIMSFYQRAVEADPRDSATRADYGRYLLVRMEDAARAEGILEAALQLDENCEIAMYNLGVLYHRYKKDLTAAETVLRRLKESTTSDSNSSPSSSSQRGAGILQLARVLGDVYAEHGGGNKIIEEICNLYEEAIITMTDPSSAASEYMKFVEQHGSNQQKLRTIESMSQFVHAEQAKQSKRVIEGGQQPVYDQIALIQNTSKLLEKMQRMSKAT